MAIHTYEETDVIEVTAPPVLLYGQPGAGKTSLGFTASKTICLDFDGGAHRSTFRKHTARFDTWEDVIEAQRTGMFDKFDSLICDTVGSLLKYMAASIMGGNAKLGNRAGGLSMQGWGVLKTTFDAWLAGLRQSGKQVIMIAHEKEERDGDNRMMRPDIAGGSYGIIMQCADIVGYVCYRNNQRSVYWEPTDSYFAKNGAGLKSGPIPDFGASPNYMADLLVQAKANLGHNAKASAELAAEVEAWRLKMEEAESLDAINALLPELGSMRPALKRQAWHLIQVETERTGCTFDKTTKKFVSPTPVEGAA